jgi:S-(hydroxymethyl)glutathione dehydrogenase/alcohol dehydrogenase
VEQVGSEVRTVKPGDHVITCLSAFCGHCEHCVTGHMSRCVSSDTRRAKTDAPRLSQEDGPMMQYLNLSSFAEQMLIHEHACVAIRKDMPLDRAALIGCGVLTGVCSVFNTAKVRPGDTVAVIGCGGVGLAAINGAAIAGASRIIAVDTLASKEGLARQFGATHFVDASDTDAVAAIRELVPSAPSRVSGALGWFGGVNWSFDCVGHPAVLRNALDVLDWGGNALAIGIPPQGTEVSVDVNALAYVDRGLLGCRYGSARPHHDIPLMVDLYLSGDLMLDELVTEQRPLEGFREIVEDMEEGKLARGVLTF